MFKVKDSRIESSLANEIPWVDEHLVELRKLGVKFNDNPADQVVKQEYFAALKEEYGDADVEQVTSYEYVSFKDKNKKK